MPAGYIQDDTARYLVSVGDELTTPEDIEGLLLFNVQGIGDVHLSDVADVFVADNSDAVYASINGNPGVMLTFSKQSNYPTATVSGNISDKFDELSGRYEGLTLTTMMDQGDYFHLIIGAIAESLGYGALFAVIILLLFLRDIKPTLITLLSIPVSIMFAIVLMYFSGVTLNMISLSGLAVAVGMLVDNSIVVIENTFRLRRMGVPAKKAAVAGAKQVSGGYSLFNADYGLRVCSYSICSGHNQRTVYRYGSDHNIFAPGKPGDSVDSGSGHVVYDVQK